MESQEQIIKFCGFYKDIKPILESLSPWEGYLYVFSVNNRLKAGQSSSIKSRITEHNKLAYFYSGNELDKVAIIGPFNDISLAEYNYFYHIRKSQKFTSIHEEWFIGDFDTMVELSLELTKAPFQSKKDIKNSGFYFKKP